MTFDEFELEVENSEKDFELLLASCDAYTEASFSEYSDNIDEISFRMESENGTLEDYNSLMEAAEESVEDRSKSTIRKIIDGCVNTIKKIINAIKGVFQKKDVDKLKEVKGTVNIPDYKALKKAEKEYEHSVNKELSKFKAGKKVDKDALESAEKKYNTKKAAITAAKVAVPVAVAALVIGDYVNATKGDPVPGDLKTVENFNGSNNPENKGDNVIMARFVSKINVEKWLNNSRIINWVKNAARGVKETVTNRPTKELSAIKDGKLESESTEIDLLDSIISDVEYDMSGLVIERGLEDIERAVGIIPHEPSFDVDDYLTSMEKELGIVDGDMIYETNTQGARADAKRLDMMKSQTARQDGLVEKSKGKMSKVDETTLRVPMGQNIYYPRFLNGEISVMVELTKSSGGVQAGTQIDAKGYNNGQLFGQVKQVLNMPQVKQFFAQLRNMEEVTKAINAYLNGFKPKKGPVQESTSDFFLDSLSDLINEDTCLSYLKEAQAFVEKINEIDVYDSIFEAESEEVKQKIVDNENNSKGAGGALQKAAHAVVEFIKNACKTIVGFFEKLFASKNEKDEFEKMKKIINSHPEYKNKKIKFYDYKHHYEELEKLAQKVEEADRKLAAGIDVDVDDLIAQISRAGITAGTVASTEITAQAALNACYGSKAFARTLMAAMERDSRIMHQLEETLGAKRANKMKKEIKSLSKDHFRLFGKRINIRRALNKERVRQCNSLMGSIDYTMKDFRRVFGKVSDALATTAENDKLRQHGGLKNNLKATANDIKMKGKLAKLYVTDRTARNAVKSAVHAYKNDEDVRNTVNQAQSIIKGVKDKKKEYWDDRRRKQKEDDYDTVDYNLRTGAGDYSAQSLLSFVTGSDKRRVEKSKRQQLLDKEANG